MNVIAIEVGLVTTRALCNNQAIVLKNEPISNTMQQTVTMIEKCLSYYHQNDYVLVVSVDFEVYSLGQDFNDLLIAKYPEISTVQVYPSGYGIIYTSGANYRMDTILVEVEEVGLHGTYYNMMVARDSKNIVTWFTPDDIRKLFGKACAKIVLYGAMSSCYDVVCTENNTYVIDDVWLNIKGLHKKGEIDIC